MKTLQSSGTLIHDFFDVSYASTYILRTDDWIKLRLGVTKSSLEISVDACSSDQSVNYLAKQINKSALGATFI